jgi:hypothetical protein
MQDIQTVPDTWLLTKDRGTMFPIGEEDRHLVVSKSFLVICMLAFATRLNGLLVCEKWSGGSFLRCRLTHSRGKWWLWQLPCVYTISFVRTVQRIKISASVTGILIMCLLYRRDMLDINLLKVHRIHQLHILALEAWTDFGMILQGQFIWLDHHKFAL